MIKSNPKMRKVMSYRCSYVLFAIYILATTNVNLIFASLEDQCDHDVVQKNLLSETPSVQDILKFHNKYCKNAMTKKIISGPTPILGYVTPWNNHGYNVAKWFNGKFDYISPVWLQIRRISPKKYAITGTHDIDTNWVFDVRKNSTVKMVPRVLFDNWTVKDAVSLSSPEERSAVVRALVEAAKKYNFDGFVIELWVQLLPLSGDDNVMLHLIKQLGQKMSDNELDFILVLPPVRGSHSVFNSHHFNYLSNIVTAFSLMTYDYSSAQNPGPNSPLPWIRQCVEHLVPEPDSDLRKKILLGMNFYGYDYTPNGGQPIIGRDYLEKLKFAKSKPKLNKESGEHLLEVKTKSGRHTIFYPTLYSVNERLKLASELGTGVAIWELGQGLDYFYQLF